ncbi:protein of unknown function [Brevefilum fermentans]|uniref:Uncharacterized protein n=1 Tax=Candidatus Brevifilum fermentans TaxID=1986204 RepID=A0A1Y6K475_9CHLR|nr:protein of unknown function [Brevefilum fermentans]
MLALLTLLYNNFFFSRLIFHLRLKKYVFISHLAIVICDRKQPQLLKPPVF